MKLSTDRTAATATHLWLTEGDDECALLADDPAAFVIGFILDQQVTVQKAFRAGWDLRERIGTIEPAALAAMPLEQLEQVFAEKPALHRYPKVMAKRVREAMQLIVDRYDGHAGRLWWEADGLDDLRARIAEVPGLGGHKNVSMTAVLARQCGVPVTGWEADVPEWGTLGDVDSPEALKAYQSRKRAIKQAKRAADAAASND
ncbi:MAG: HhH-GPD family protein [Thermoleophilia bacterium]|nr:HhH-GPD family protein [Thermoleophilia bacterium]